MLECGGGERPKLSASALCKRSAPQNYGDDPVFNRQHNLQGFLAASYDGGVTWTNTSVVGALPGRFATPVPISCGQANAPCSATDGDLTYIFFPGTFNDASYWDGNDFMRVRHSNNTPLRLGRDYSAPAGCLSTRCWLAGL